VDKNFGLAVGFVPSGHNYVPFQLLFDTFDVFIDETNCNQLGKKLGEVMAAGDFVKFNAVRVEPAVEKDPPPVREVRYLATALVTADTASAIKGAAIPGSAARVTSLDQVTKEKITNFRTVVAFLGGKAPGPAEERLLEAVARGDLATQVLNWVKPWIIK
jgi:hypothetical protein